MYCRQYCCLLVLCNGPGTWYIVQCNMGGPGDFPVSSLVP